VCSLVSGNRWHCVIPYGKWHFVAVAWNTSINGYTVPFNLSLLQNYAKMWKLHGSGQIPQLSSKFRVPQKTGPHWLYVSDVLFEHCRHDIEKLTNEIVNKTTNDLRQLSTLTTQTPDNRVSEWPNYCRENYYPTYFTNIFLLIFLNSFNLTFSLFPLILLHPILFSVCPYCFSFCCSFLFSLLLLFLFCLLIFFCILTPLH